MACKQTGAARASAPGARRSPGAAGGGGWGGGWAPRFPSLPPCTLLPPRRLVSAPPLAQSLTTSCLAQARTLWSAAYMRGVPLKALRLSWSPTMTPARASRGRAAQESYSPRSSASQSGVKRRTISASTARRQARTQAGGVSERRAVQGGAGRRAGSAWALPQCPARQLSPAATHLPGLHQTRSSCGGPECRRGLQPPSPPQTCREKQGAAAVEAAGAGCSSAGRGGQHRLRTVRQRTHQKSSTSWARGASWVAMASAEEERWRGAAAAAQRREAGGRRAAERRLLLMP